MRLFMVMVFTFGASTTAANFSYGLQEDLVTLSVEQINQGKLPPGTQLGDYVEITGGTPTLDHNPRRVGTPDSEIAYSLRYQTPYFYFGLEETGDNLLIQTVQTLPDFDQDGEWVWRGKLSNVGTVIFQDTTQRALGQANLPRDEHPGHRDRRHSAVPPADLPCLLGDHRNLAALHGLARLEEE